MDRLFAHLDPFFARLVVGWERLSPHGQIGLWLGVSCLVAYALLKWRDYSVR